MSEGFDTIRKLGSQKIHEQTHITRKSIDDILDKNFEAMNRVQFSGFISILEREYGLDLSELKGEFEAYHREHHTTEEVSEVFVPSGKEAGSKKWLLAAAVALLLIVVMSLTVNEEEERAPEPIVLAQSNATDILPASVQEQNLSVSEPEPEEPALPEHLAVIPSTKLWVGYVDLSNFKKGQKLTEESFELNATKDWLFVFGHGYLAFEIGDEVQKFSDKNRLWFLYKDGLLKEITNEEFKMHNRGRNW